MKEFKQNSAITLIALIVTIIILLILAGITISQLTYSGLFSKTKIATNKSNYANAKEMITRLIYQAKIECYSQNKDITLVEISNCASDDTEIVLEKYYLEPNASKANNLQEPGEGNEIAGIIVKSRQYPDYHFLIGKSYQIEKITMKEIPESINDKSLILIADFEKNILNNSDKNQEKISDIKLNKESAELFIGDKLNLIANIEPISVTNKNLKWTTTNSNVITVSDDGQVSAIAEGTADVVCNSIDGNIERRCRISVVEGTEIRTRSDLENIKNNKAGNYRLMANIDLSESNWISIPSFSGTLNGNGYTISNMTIESLSSEMVSVPEGNKTCAGFFATLESDAKIYDLKFDNCNLLMKGLGSGERHTAGILAGGCKTAQTNISIERVGIIGGIVKNADVRGWLYTAALIGTQYGSNISYKDCYALDTIIENDFAQTGDVGTKVGGLVAITGDNGAVFERCYFAGQIFGYGKNNASSGYSAIAGNPRKNRFYKLLL